MAEKLLTEMNYSEMNTLMDSFIERSSQESGEMPASDFFELLFAQASQRAKKTHEIEGRIVDGQLMFMIPTLAMSNLHVQNNQIIVGDQRIIIKLAEAQ